jgi:uncharacterized damage-inducible protein DinB
MGQHAGPVGPAGGWWSVSEIQPLRTQVALMGEVAAAAVADITHDESLGTPIPGVNGMNWILGHLVHVDAAILELLQHPGDPSSAELARYAPGSPFIGEGADAWDFAVLREALPRQTSLLDQALASAPPELLASVPPEGFEGELSHFLHFITFHQGYHVGQLGLLRRARGYGRAFG